MNEFLQQLINGLAVGGIYALVALGYTMVYGVLKLINFAHGDIFTIGAYLGMTLLVSGGLSGSMTPVLAVGLVVIIVFGLVALLGVAGVMVGTYYGQIDFTMGWSYGLKAFTAAILGGIGNIPGAMIGGLLLGVIEALGASYLAMAWKDAIAFLVLILILIIRPTGLLGERVADKL